MLTLPASLERLAELPRRITYQPKADVLQSHKGIQGVSEHQFVTDELSINLIEAG